MLRWKALAQGVRTSFGFAGYADGDPELVAENGGNDNPEKPVFDNGPLDPKLELFGDDAPEGAEIEEKESEPVEMPV